jgi:hypothetical protein
MNRREFLWTSGMAAGGMLSFSLSGCATVERGRIRWTRNSGARLVSAVACDGEPFASSNSAVGVLEAAIRQCGTDGSEVVRLGADRARAELGPLQAELRHRLLDSGAGEDVLEATVSIHNETNQAQEIEVIFLTSLQPGADLAQQHIYVPLSAAGGSRDPRFTALGVKGFLENCEQQVGANDFACHYLEPMASFPAERTTRALLLAPAVDIFHPVRPWRVALFTVSDQPVRFGSLVITWAVRFGKRAGRSQ